MSNDPQYAISNGSSLQYELTKLEDVQEAAQAAVNELKDFYNKAKKVFNSNS